MGQMYSALESPRVTTVTSQDDITQNRVLTMKHIKYLTKGKGLTTFRNW